MKAIIYYRKSTDSQDFTRQINDIANYCSKEGLEVVKEYSETESGTKKIRPELTALIAYCKINKPDFVIHAAGIVGGIAANINDPIKFKKLNYKNG